MPMRTVIMSAVVGLVALAVSGCVSDPYYGYDGYGPYYDPYYDPYHGGGYYAGGVIVYDSGPRVQYRPRYVEPPRYRPHRVYRERGPRNAYRPHRQARQPARELRGDHRPRQFAPAPRHAEARQLRGRQSPPPQDRRALRTQDRPWDGKRDRRSGR